MVVVTSCHDNPPLRRAGPLHDTRLFGLRLRQRKASQVVPRNALGAAEVRWDFASHLFQDDYGLCDRIFTEEEYPVG